MREAAGAMMQHQDLDWDYSALLTWLRALLYMAVTVAAISLLRFCLQVLDAETGHDLLPVFSWLFELLYYPYHLILPAVTMAFFREPPIARLPFVSSRRSPWIVGGIGLALALAVANIIDVSGSEGLGYSRVPEGVLRAVTLGFIWAGVAALLHWVWLRAAPIRWMALHIFGLILATVILVQMEGQMGNVQAWLSFYPAQEQGGEIYVLDLQPWQRNAAVAISWLLTAALSILPYAVGMAVLHQQEIARRDWRDETDLTAGD